MKRILPLLVSLAALTSCGGSDDRPDEPQPPEPDQPEATLPDLPFARGADVSWVTEEEAAGKKWYNSAGQVTDIFRLLKDECGVNAIRLRVWVDPASGYNGLDDVLVKARRAHALGLMLMIDFHFSDTWADPGHQSVPAAWSGYDFARMKQAVAGHVEKVLEALKAEDIEPQWVQIGNETRNGMLWPIGQADLHASNFAALVSAGYDAVKKILPEAYVIVHVDQGNVWSHYEWLFGILSTYGARYDMIGMSLYPDTDTWQADCMALLANINRCWNRWDKPVMICETGMHWQEADACRDMLATLIRGCLDDTSGHGKGIFYWEPQSTPGINGGYDKGAFTPEGTATSALSAFKNIK